MINDGDLLRRRARQRLSVSLPYVDPTGTDVQTSSRTSTINMQKIIDSYDKNELLKICIQIIKRPINQRSYDQIQILHKMANQLQFFKEISLNYGMKVFSGCLNCIRHQQVKKNDVIFRSGDRGGNFYIILEGRVGIFIVLPSLNDPTIFEQKKVNDLGPGETFGELALLYDDSKRSATVIAQTDCELAYMDKIEYKRVIGSHQREILNQKIEFLQKQPWLQKWSKREINTLSYHFISQIYVSGEFVFQEGDPSNELFIVREGVFEMSKIFQKQNFKNLKFSQINSGLNKLRYIPMRKTLCVLDQGQLFGEECFLFDNSFQLQLQNNSKKPRDRLVTVQCKSLKGELFRINKQDIEQRFWDPQTAEVFTKTMQLILDFRIKRINTLENSVGQGNKQLEEFFQSENVSPKDIRPPFKYQLIDDTIFIQENKSLTTANSMIEQLQNSKQKKMERLAQASINLSKIKDQDASPTYYRREHDVRLSRRNLRGPLKATISKSCLSKIRNSVKESRRDDSFYLFTQESSEKEKSPLVSAYQYILMNSESPKPTSLSFDERKSSSPSLKVRDKPHNSQRPTQKLIKRLSIKSFHQAKTKLNKQKLRTIIIQEDKIDSRVEHHLSELESYKKIEERHTTNILKPMWQEANIGMEQKKYRYKPIKTEANL